MFIVEFRHPHFGWLDYEREFETREAADAFAKTQGKAYPIRVRDLSPKSPNGLDAE